MAMLMPLWTGTRAPDDELRLATEALALAEAQAHAWCQALALNHVAHAHWHLGDVERYEIAQRDSVRLWRMIGDRIGLAYSLRQQGEVDALRGRRAEAHGSFVEAALLLEEMGDRLGLAEVVAALSTLQVAEGRSDHAAWLSDAGQALARSVGAPLVAMTTPFATGTGGTPAAAGTWAHALGSMADVAVIVEYVRALARPGAPALPAGSTGPAPALTPRESEVLVLLGEGLTNQQIARLLRISIKTVERHTDSLYRKLGAANRAGAVALAYQQGLLSAQERPA
jgi:DNA-binding CsgD family transcriptional regulator